MTKDFILFILYFAFVFSLFLCHTDLSFFRSSEYFFCTTTAAAKSNIYAVCTQLALSVLQYLYTAKWYKTFYYINDDEGSRK